MIICVGSILQELMFPSMNARFEPLVFLQLATKVLVTERKFGNGKDTLVTDRKIGNGEDNKYKKTGAK